jgi:hypothetical protein
MALTGQVSTQAPQEMQASVILKAIDRCTPFAEYMEIIAQGLVPVSTFLADVRVENSATGLTPG